MLKELRHPPRQFASMSGGATPSPNACQRPHLDCETACNSRASQAHNFPGVSDRQPCVRRMQRRARQLARLELARVVSRHGASLGGAACTRLRANGITETAKPTFGVPGESGRNGTALQARREKNLRSAEKCALCRIPRRSNTAWRTCLLGTQSADPCLIVPWPVFNSFSQAQLHGKSKMAANKRPSSAS